MHTQSRTHAHTHASKCTDMARAPLAPHALPKKNTNAEKAQDGQELVFTYSFMLESEAFIIDAIRRLGPFDGLCGFSQARGGACMHWLCAGARAGGPGQARHA